MRIIGMGICGPDEPYLEQTLKEFKRLCDETVICLNGVGENTKKLIQSYGFHTVDDRREWGKFQHIIKRELVEGAVKKLNPDWVVALDMDEVFDQNVTRESLENLAQKGGAGYYFFIVNLYNEGYARDWSFWNVRFWNFNINREWENKALHPGLAPKDAYRYGNYAPYTVEHYGLKDVERRAQKVERYKLYDPDAKYKGRDYYNFLANKHYKPQPYIKENVYDEVSREIMFYKHKQYNMEKNVKRFYYVSRPLPKWGDIIEVPEAHLKQTLENHPEFTLVNEQPSEEHKGPIGTTVLGGRKEETTHDIEKKEIEEAPKQEFKCEKCPFISKSAFGLRAHVRKHDRDNSGQVRNEGV